uniref:Uncharacterized protein n=1 Tax=Chromera velia CCMP2878 TaxID=1169474 RepID=A0A0K6SAI6_9ALVE|eukprot:Cvel_11062.t1-p1 / transcript=Cvel_11062.t1 / gene=Cvel_11062 / organism=Chromera_velia_CCMP2878 / gene_product=hypothetical protein / transcript_product=hypothetical protein / location=Cvel_scaffold682:56262-65936(+) / protein_length=1257 / sequence_SO=supercontig / SO=protein_coding / is_pseudo=false
MERWGQGGGPKVHCGDAIAWISVHILFISGVEWTTLPHDGWKVRRLKPFTSGVIQTLTRKDLTAAEEERSRWEERSSEPSQMKGKGSPRGGKGKGRGRSKTKREGGGSPRKGGAGAAPGRIGTDGSVREFREVVSDEGLVTGCTCFRNPLEMESQSPLKTYREHLAELKELKAARGRAFDSKTQWRDFKDFASGKGPYKITKPPKVTSLKEYSTETSGALWTRSTIILAGVRRERSKLGLSTSCCTSSASEPENRDANRRKRQNGKRKKRAAHPDSGATASGHVSANGGHHRTADYTLSSSAYDGEDLSDCASVLLRTPTQTNGSRSRIPSPVRSQVEVTTPSRHRVTPSPSVHGPVGVPESEIDAGGTSRSVSGTTPTAAASSVPTFRPSPSHSSRVVCKESSTQRGTETGNTEAQDSSVITSPFGFQPGAAEGDEGPSAARTNSRPAATPYFATRPPQDGHPPQPALKSSKTMPSLSARAAVNPNQPEETEESTPAHVQTDSLLHKHSPRTSGDSESKHPPSALRSHFASRRSHSVTFSPTTSVQRTEGEEGRESTDLHPSAHNPPGGPQPPAPLGSLVEGDETEEISWERDGAHAQIAGGERVHAAFDSVQRIIGETDLETSEVEAALAELRRLRIEASTNWITGRAHVARQQHNESAASSGEREQGNAQTIQDGRKERIATRVSLKPQVSTLKGKRKSQAPVQGKLASLTGAVGGAAAAAAAAGAGGGRTLQSEWMQSVSAWRSMIHKEEKRRKMLAELRWNFDFSRKAWERSRRLPPQSEAERNRRGALLRLALLNNPSMRAHADTTGPANVYRSSPAHRRRPSAALSHTASERGDSPDSPPRRGVSPRNSGKHREHASANPFTFSISKSPSAPSLSSHQWNPSGLDAGTLAAHRREATAENFSRNRIPPPPGMVDPHQTPQSISSESPVKHFAHTQPLLVLPSLAQTVSEACAEVEKDLPSYRDNDAVAFSVHAPSPTSRAVDSAAAKQVLSFTRLPADEKHASSRIAISTLPQNQESSSGETGRNLMVHLSDSSANVLTNSGGELGRTVLPLENRLPTLAGPRADLSTFIPPGPPCMAPLSAAFSEDLLMSSGSQKGSGGSGIGFRELHEEDDPVALAANNASKAGPGQGTIPSVTPATTTAMKVCKGLTRMDSRPLPSYMSGFGRRSHVPSLALDDVLTGGWGLPSLRAAEAASRFCATTEALEAEKRKMEGPGEHPILNNPSPRSRAALSPGASRRRASIDELLHAYS